MVMDKKSRRSLLQTIGVVLTSIFLVGCSESGQNSKSDSTTKEVSTKTDMRPSTTLLSQPMTTGIQNTEERRTTKKPSFGETTHISTENIDKIVEKPTNKSVIYNKICGNIIIRYDSLPEKIQKEVEISIKKGKYVVWDNLLLDDVVNVSNSYIEYNGEYYQATIIVADIRQEDGSNRAKYTLKMKQIDSLPSRNNDSQCRVE